jgi:site-specific DNA recombinase
MFSGSSVAIVVAAMWRNVWGLIAAEIEARVVCALKGLLLDPDVIAEAVCEFNSLSNRRQSQTQAAHQKLEPELSEVKRRASRLIDQVAEGNLAGAAVKEGIEALEVKRNDPEKQLAGTPPPHAVAVHPAAHQRFHALVENMSVTLSQAETSEIAKARTDLRSLIRSVTITPGAERGAFEVTVESEMAALMTQGGHITTVGAGIGFEPMTFRL